MKSTQLQRAVQLIARRILEDPRQDLAKLISESCQDFDLSPLDGEFLKLQFLYQEIVKK